MEWSRLRLLNGKDWHIEVGQMPSDIYECYVMKLSNSLIDLMNDLALTQVVDHPTRKDSILDLFLTSNPTLLNRFTTTPPPTVKADHDIVFIDLNTRPHLPQQSPNTRYLYNKADSEGMKKKMSSYMQAPSCTCSGGMGWPWGNNQVICRIICSLWPTQITTAQALDYQRSVDIYT